MSSVSIRKIGHAATSLIPICEPEQSRFQIGERSGIDQDLGAVKLPNVIARASFGG